MTSSVNEFSLHVVWRGSFASVFFFFHFTFLSNTATGTFQVVRFFTLSPHQDQGSKRLHIRCAVVGGWKTIIFCHFHPTLRPITRTFHLLARGTTRQSNRGRVIHKRFGSFFCLRAYARARARERGRNWKWKKKTLVQIVWNHAGNGGKRWASKKKEKQIARWKTNACGSYFWWTVSFSLSHYTEPPEDRRGGSESFPSGTGCRVLNHAERFHRIKPGKRLIECRCHCRQTAPSLQGTFRAARSAVLGRIGGGGNVKRVFFLLSLSLSLYHTKLDG